MKAEVVYGTLIKIDGDKVTVVIEEKGKTVETEYPHSIPEFDETWVANNLGKPQKIIIVNGAVAGFR